MYYLLLLVSICLAVCKSSLYNVYAKKSESTMISIFGFNTVAYGVAALISLFIFIFGEKTVSLSTVLCAVLYAAVVFSLQTLSVSAMRVGTMSLTSICVMYGMIIPSLAGPIFWSEPFGALQVFGILMMLVSLWLLKGKSTGDEKQKISAKWVVLAAICFLLSGMAGLTEKIHQSTDGRDEKAVFVLLACLFMFIFSVGLSAFSYTKEKKIENAKGILKFGAVSGSVIAIYSIVNLTLAGNLPSIICYPVSNGGAMLMTVVVSYFAFSEKLDKYKLTGVVLGLLGIVMLSIPV